MSFANTSILVNRQVPEFIRDEYPLFITFLEAYYEFLEQKQTGEENDLTQQAKNLRYVSDVDQSIDEFQTSFFNTYASLLPNDVQVDKEFLIKNVLPLYLSKGSEAAFKLLFRLLYNDEVSIIQPRNNVLRASDGRWTIDNVLRVETDVRSVYTGNGANTEFVIAQQVNTGEIDVYVDGVLKTEGTDYFIRKESRKVVFVSAPSSNTDIEVYYDDFNVELLTNRKITGTVSGATALIERAVPRIITDQLNFGLPFELFINSKTLIGDFVNGETITTDIIDDNGVVINLVADTFSILTKINVVDGGSSYNVGDPVVIVGGGATTSATAEVSEVSDGFTSRIVVNYGGAGFKLASIITSTNLPTLITGAVDAVNTSHFTANTYSVTQDIIADYANTSINVADYGFPAPFSENLSTRIVDALTPLEVTGLGPITNAVILFSNTSTNNAILDSQGAIYQAGSYFYDIKDFRSIGRIDITSGGLNYKVGDDVIFGSNPPSTYGVGASAYVSTVAANGAVTKITIGPPAITGTANVLNNTVQITGTNTVFLNDLQVGDRIIIAGQSRYINAISSNTAANVNVSFSFTDSTTYANNRLVLSYNKGPIGGVNYTQNSFPTTTVSTASGGSSANVNITSLMGDGERLAAFTDAVAGEILAIRLTTGGVGYEYIPQVDLTGSGDGTAIANAVVGSSYVTLPGRWTTSDSILSSSERKLQGPPYYSDYAYVTSSLTSFTKYKQILRDLLHPAGFANYADLNKESTIPTGTPNVIISTTDTLSGTVNVNASIYIIGTGTKFNIANGNTISIGSNVAVNGEIRTINSILANTVMTVSSAFTTYSNSQTLIIVT